ncbi:hypothetical protein [Jeotgalibacillus salarius]|uniref:Uncharacterized protein n=1 Tax=Jeotgalibacillus salarius TaxID=546023 RepID=A0A4Y8LIU7_9BACL|nr:hypothetical protein [Jeotgalibacillus salarius]TFE02311.1 hypothetical protein E2626_06955 [Jeotgalibacillus salarius]
MKILKVLGFIAIAVLVFFAVYITNQQINPQEVSREVQFGYQDGDQPERINFEKVYSDIEDQSVIDNTMMIFMHKETSDEEMSDVEPDMHIWVSSPTQSAVLIESRIWFTEQGAIIGERAGESWDQVEYFEINEQDAAYLKEQGGYDESL